MEKLINLKESSSKLRLKNQLEKIRSKRYKNTLKKKTTLVALILMS